jgi:acyl-coenzyme A synthetase/AMP-(fatty) acid ligase
VFKRIVWMGIGAAAGSAGTVWAQQQVRRRLDALGPDHLVVTAGNTARSAARKVGRTVTDAVVEGRTAMRDREEELTVRRDGARPARANHRTPAGGRAATRPSSW